MKLADLERAQDLERALAHADRVLEAFQRAVDEAVPVVATLDYGRAKVELLPVPKQVAVSAAQRERAKIVAELAQLGVTVDDGGRMAAPELKPYQQRVVAERDELDDRRAKLLAFMDGPVHEALPLAEKFRLGRQLKAMSEYSDVLLERIEAFA